MLVANQQSEGEFAQSVILLLDIDEEGALGVILNRLATVATLAGVLPQWEHLVSEPQELFHGGPVSPDGAICLASVRDLQEEPPGWRRLFGTVGLLHLDTPVEIAEGTYEDLRIFAGYSGWAPQQLERELMMGAWYQTGAHYDDVFGPEPDGMWARVLRRQRSELAWFSTWTETPDLN